MSALQHRALTVACPRCTAPCRKPCPTARGGYHVERAQLAMWKQPPGSGERWLPIPGWADAYLVDVTTARVRSQDRTVVDTAAGRGACRAWN